MTKKIMALQAFMLLSILAIANFIPAFAVNIPEDFESEPSDNGNFRIHYTTDCQNPLGDCVKQNTTDVEQKELVTTLGKDLEDILTTYTTGDFRFKDPVENSEMTVIINDLGSNLLGQAHRDGNDKWFELAPIIFSDTLSSRKTSMHELFHIVQYTYGQWSSKFLKEGTAGMIQDKVYDDLDQSNGAEMGSYFNRVNFFLNNTNITLTNQTYLACLFWTYFTEQYGTVTTEPQVGIDAIRILFEQHGSGSDDIQRVDAALDILSPGTTFRDVFMDFIVANYAKDLTGPNVPSKYQYLDDDQPPWAYNSVSPLKEKIGVGTNFSATDEIPAWAAKYYEVELSANVPVISIDFHQPTTPAVTLVYNLLVIKDNNIVMEASDFNVLGQDFVRSVVNRDYEKVVVVVGALDHQGALVHQANFQYEISAGDSALNILWPQEDNPTFVNINDLNNFQVHLKVVKSGTVVRGLDPDDFRVTVGTTDINIVTGAEVMGQYWLVIQPTALRVGTYDLKVSLTNRTLSDTEPVAVRFGNKINADSVIVIDRSGSMLEPNWKGLGWETPDLTDKIYGAINAATLYVNSFRTGDKMGLVWFSNDAYTFDKNNNSALKDFNEANRVDLINRINTFDENEAGAWMGTSIGDGLSNAQEELEKGSIAGYKKVIILLSDGKENQGRFINEVLCDVGCDFDPNIGVVCDDYCNFAPNTTDTVIYTIALGSNADREKLEELAYHTGGFPLYAEEPNNPSFRRSSVGSDLPNDLADIYRFFAEDILQEQRIATIRDDLIGFRKVSHTINIETGATEATVVVNYNSFGYCLPQVTLLDPTGTVVDLTYNAVNNQLEHHLFKIPSPQSGAWTVKLEGDDNEFGCKGNYLITASVKSKATVEAFLGIPPDERINGAYLPILVFLTDTQPIIGATVQAEITTPPLEGALAVFPEEVNTLRLYDDGHHGDGKANDGVYGNIFRNTDRVGIYNINISAEGKGGKFKRETKLAFNMRKDVDFDQDGLPDRWERKHGLNPKDSSGNDGAKGDPDLDSLTNAKEFDLGTAPLDPDTDNGGELDNTEVLAGRDPNNPLDDAVKFPTSLRAIAGINQVTLAIGYRHEHDELVVLKATNPAGPWEYHVIQATDNYTDDGLQNEVTYYYKVVGISKQRGYKISGPTRVVSATPKADPIPPSGYVVINNGAYEIEQEDVTLTLWADPDTIEMKISNEPKFTNATWENFNKNKSWKLLPGTGLRTVYVQFKDAADNIGPRDHDPSVEIQPAMDGIILVPTPDHSIKGQILDEQHNLIAGVTVQVGDKIAVSDEKGYWKIDGLGKEEYTLTASKDAHSVTKHFTVENDNLVIEIEWGPPVYTGPVIKLFANDNGIVAADTLVGVFNTADGNVNTQPYVYSLAKGEDDTHNSLFTIKDDELKTKTVINFDEDEGAKNLYFIRVKTTNKLFSRLYFEKSFAILVVKPNTRAAPRRAVVVEGGKLNITMPPILNGAISESEMLLGKKNFAEAQFLGGVTLSGKETALRTVTIMPQEPITVRGFINVAPAHVKQLGDILVSVAYTLPNAETAATMYYWKTPEGWVTEAMSALSSKVLGKTEEVNIFIGNVPSVPGTYTFHFGYMVDSAIVHNSAPIVVEVLP